MIRPNEDLPVLGIGLVLAAYLAFSFIDTSAKWLGLLGLSALQLSFMRYVGHFVISTGLLVRDAEFGQLFSSEHRLLALIRGSLLMASTVLNFIAIQYLPLTLTSTILFSAPIIVCALSYPLLGERVGIVRWLAIMAGFVGILVAIRPFDDSFHSAVFLSLAGATSFAFYTILTRKLAGKESTNVLQFYSGAVGTLVLLPFAIVFWRNPETLLDWSIMVGLGFFGWLGHQMMTTAYRFADASALTPFAYSFTLFLTVWSYLVFDHLPDRWTLAGALIIVAAGLMIWFRERKRGSMTKVNSETPIQP